MKNINIYDIDTFVRKIGVIEIDEKKFEFLQSSTEIMPFILSKKWISMLMFKDERYWLITFATHMRVIEKLLNIDTGIITVKIEFDNGNDIIRREFGSEIFNKYGARTLLEYGIRFSEKNVDLVIDYLIASEGQAKFKKNYSKLGWFTENHEIIFHGDVAVSGTGILSDYYNGNLDLTPHGRLKDWINMVKREVIGNIPLTFVMTLGFASPILAFLNKKYDLATILFSLSNTSSKGKTTSAMLAASIFSNPAMNRGTLITYNSTENAMIEFLSTCQGYTVGLDEVAVSNVKDFKKFLYTVCGGVSKMRLNADSSSKPIKKFDSIIISTAEFDILTDDSPKGLQARVFQINDNLTVSAENSDNIKRCVIENYAVAGSTFIQYVIQDELCNIQDDYEKFKKLLIKKCKNVEALTERIFSKLAVVLVTAQYVEESFGINLQIDELIEYTLGIERNISVRKTPEENLLEIIQQEVLRNYTKYILDGKMPQGQCFGAVVEGTDYIEFQITESTLKDIFKKNSINDYKQILNKLKQQGQLVTEPDRLYKRLVLMREFGRQKCYCFRTKNNTKIDSYVEEIKSSNRKAELKKATEPLEIDDASDEWEL